MEHTPVPEREQVKSSLQEKLTNFLDKILDQAGLLANSAGEALRNLIPSGVPTWPFIPIRKVLHIFRRHVPPDQRQCCRTRRAHHNQPSQA